MNPWTFPDGRVLAAEHAYRRDALLDAARSAGASGGGRARRDAVRLSGTRRRAVPTGRPTRPRTALSPDDLSLGHSAVCR